MQRVMVRCPGTGMAIPTGLLAEGPSQFARTPVFMARVHCPFCARDHDWFAREAWVEEQQGGERRRLEEEV